MKKMSDEKNDDECCRLEMKWEKKYSTIVR
jgi:hypothetical protein